MSRKKRKNTEKLMRAVALGSMACFAVLCVAGWSLSSKSADKVVASVSSSKPQSSAVASDEPFIGPSYPEHLSDQSSEEPSSAESSSQLVISSEPSSVVEVSSAVEPPSEAEPSSVVEPSSEPEPVSEPSSEEEDEEDNNNTSWEWNESDARDWRDEEKDSNTVVRPSSSTSTKPSSSSAPSSSTPSSSSKPSSSEEEEDDDWYYDEDVFERELIVKVNGQTVRKEAYEMIYQIVANEMGTSFHEEAMKAQAVAAYTMIVYNNNNGTYPTVGLRTSVPQRVKDAVAEVLGEMVYYNGKIAHTVYHSTSGGQTTSATEVWGGTGMDYLVSVDSYWDEDAPNFKSEKKFTPTNFAALVDDVYGIDLWEYSDDPADWLEIVSYDSGGYVGTVSLGGRTKGLSGGTYGKKEISGRSIREQLLNFQIRSHNFDYEYDEDADRIIFTTYGYGHGVGMSQYGAQFMALDGYDYEEILTHYYTDVVVR